MDDETKNMMPKEDNNDKLPPQDVNPDTQYGSEMNDNVKQTFPDQAKPPQNETAGPVEDAEPKPVTPAEPKPETPAGTITPAEPVEQKDYPQNQSPSIKPGSKKTAAITIIAVIALIAAAAVLIIVLITKNSSDDTSKDPEYSNADGSIISTTLPDSSTATNPSDVQSSEASTGETQPGQTETTTQAPAPTAKPDVNVTLGQYKELEAKRTVTEVTDDNVQTEIDNFLKENSTLVEITDRTDVQEGDVANIDYEGLLDGKAFEGGTDTGADLTIGSNSFINGFETGLIGVKVGESKSLNLTFPDPYTPNPDMAGKDVVFNVKINKISKETTPELTADFISENTEFTSIDEYRADVRKRLEENNAAAADQAMQTDLVMAAIGNATYEGDLHIAIGNEAENMKAYYEQLASAYYGVDAATLFNLMYGMDADAYNDFIIKSSENSVKQLYMLEAIVEAEKLTLTQEEFDAGLKKFMNDYNFTTEEEYYQNISKEDTEHALLTEKALNLIFDTAIITE